MPSDSALNDQPAAQPREEAWGSAPPHYRLADAPPPQPREYRCACQHNTGPTAEGGGGWPMHATAQPWHAEGRPTTTGALRCRDQPQANRSAGRRCSAIHWAAQSHLVSIRLALPAGTRSCFSCPTLAEVRYCWTCSILAVGYWAGERSIPRSAAFARSKAAAVPDWLAHG